MEEEQEYDRAPKKMGRTVHFGIIIALVAGLAFLAGFFTGSGRSTLTEHIPLFSDGLDATPDTTANLNEFWKAWNILSSRFVETHASSSLPSIDERLWGAIAGLAGAYGDPYTVYLPPADAKVFQEDISGNFSGVGMEIGPSKEGVLSVIAPLKNTPAERAGILAGDTILAIDGQSTEGMPTDEAVKLIRGKKGTTVSFRMYRAGEFLDISVTRDVIQVPTIAYGYNATAGVYTISIYSFTANVNGQFNQALRDFRNSGTKNLIIDLRGNPGGYLESAVALASHFLPEGEIVVTEDYRGTEENVEHRSRGTGGVPDGTKIVILIDKGSASASEILAGALQDAHGATLVGERSFGKGSVQELVEIDGGALKVTVARWLTPSGRSISDGGLTPDIEVARTTENVAAGLDPQMERAVEFLVEGT